MRRFLTVPRIPGALPLAPAQGLPGASSLSASLPPAVRRTAVEVLLSQPRTVEVVPVVERVRRVTFNVLGVGLGLALLGLYLSTRAHNPGVDTARMQATVAYLRRARMAARARLLAAATEHGEVPLEGASGRVLKWWATGPRAASHTVLLAAEDGESSAVWGEVHARLAAAQPSARIISYHCAGGQPPSPGVTAPALTLRLRDAQAALLAAAAPASRVVHVRAGAGAWPGLALAALHPHTTAGLVLCAPLLFHRQRALAWMDAVPAASRTPSQADPGLLQRLLDPPPAPLTPALQERLDSLHPRRKDMVGFWDRFGTQGTKAAAAGRFAEDFRRWRAGQTVFSSREMGLVKALAPALGAPQGGGAAVPVRAITWGESALPSWMEAATARATLVHCIMAATALGAMMAQAPSSAPVPAPAVAAAAGVEPLPDLLVKVPETEARHVGSLLERLPAALGLGGSSSSSSSSSKLAGAVEARLRQLASELEGLPVNFSLTLLEGRQAGGVEEGLAAGGEDVASFPLQCPEAIVREVQLVLRGEGGRREQGRGFLAAQAQ